MSASGHFIASILDFAAAQHTQFAALAQGIDKAALLLTAEAMRLGAQHVREESDEPSSAPVNDLASAAALLRENAKERRTREQYERRNGDPLCALDYACQAAALSFAADYLLSPAAATAARIGRTPARKPCISATLPKSRLRNCKN
jgi:hypothetical protein